MSRIARASLVLGLLLPLTPALSQAQSTGTVTRGDDAAGASTSTSTSTSGGGGGGSSAAALGDEQALLEEREAPPPQRSGFEPGEIHDETYIFVGALARVLIIPSYPFDIAEQETAGYDAPANGAGGLYFNYRRNAFNVQLEVLYQGMQWEGFVRDRNDPITETEFIRSRLGLVLGYVGFGWAFDIADWFAIELGFGLGFGGLVGDLFRQEAYQPTPSTWARCNGPGDPVGGDFCDTGPAADGIERPNPANGRLDDDRIRGGSYQITETGPNPFYFGPGGVPPIFFTIDLPRLSFRFKPIHQLQIRIDTAFNVYGISLGGSVGYGF